MEKFKNSLIEYIWDNHFTQDNVDVIDAEELETFILNYINPNGDSD